MIMHRYGGEKVFTLAAAIIALSWIAQPSMGRAEPVQWNMTGVLSSGAEIAKRIEVVSGGTIEITAHKPGELFPHFGLFKAIGEGRVDLGFSLLGYWSKEIPSAPLFSAVPFGPSAPEYLAWMHHGGGQELMQGILRPHGIHPILCAIAAPEASGWFRKEIKSAEDLQGLKMRFFGLGALVMEKFGVTIRVVPPRKVYAALESGEIDATEFSTPARDLNWGFHKIAKHYYFPGWHQPYTLVALMINQGSWTALSETQKAQVEAACSNNLIAMLAEDEASQVDALRKLKAEGVQLHRWSPDILNAFKNAWNEVAGEMSGKDADFKQVWTSLSEFRENYKIWRELATAE